MGRKGGGTAWVRLKGDALAIWALAPREGYPKLPSLYEGIAAEAMALHSVRESFYAFFLLGVVSVGILGGSSKFRLTQAGMRSRMLIDPTHDSRREHTPELIEVYSRCGQ